MLDLLKVLKANPYHDEQGLFSTKDRAHFQSIGGVFDRQRAKQIASGADKPKSYPRTVAGFTAELEQLKKDGLLSKYTGDAAFLAENMHAQSGGKLGPMELVKTMLGDSYGRAENQGTVVLEARGNNIVFSQGSGVTHGARHKTMARTFDFRKLDVHHDFLKLHDDDQGSGAVKRLFQASIPQYKRLGMKTITLQANLDGGAYAWGKYGFKADRPGDYKDEFDTGRDSLATKMRRAGATLSPEARKEWVAASELIKASRESKDIAQIMSDMKTPNLDYELADHGLISGKRPTFIKGVMKDKSWNGTLSLSSLGRLNKYMMGKP